MKTMNVMMLCVVMVIGLCGQVSAALVNYSDNFESYSDYEGAPWAGDTQLEGWWTGAPLGGAGYEGAWPDKPTGNKALAIISGSAAPHFTVYEGGTIDATTGQFTLATDVLQMYGGTGNAGGVFFNAQGDLKTGYKLDFVDMSGHIGWRVVRLQNATSDADYNPDTTSSPYVEVSNIAIGTQSAPLRVEVTGTNNGHFNFKFFNKAAPSTVYNFAWSDGGSPLVGGYLGVQGNGWAEFYFDNVAITNVPEPATMFLLAVGGIFLRRRHF